MKIYMEEDGSVYLRLLTKDDTDNIVKWRNNDKVRKNFIYQELFTSESHEKWIVDMIDTGKVIQMIICEMSSDTPIGSVYIRDIDYKHKKAEYGIFIGEDSSRGKGYGSAVARMMVQYSFQEIGLHKLFLRVFADNTQAIQSYENAGFVKEAFLKDDVYVDNKYKDIVLMAVINQNE